MLQKSSLQEEKNKDEDSGYVKMLEEKLERTLKLLDEDEKGGEDKEESRSSSSGGDNENENENKASPTSPFDLESSYDDFLLKPESDEGSVEYKRHLVNPSARNFEKLTTQLLWRLNEGGGECLYEIGVDDDGFVRGISEEEMKFSVETLEKMAKQLSAKVSEAFERKTSEKERFAKCALVRKIFPKEANHLELRITTVGNVDSGKSTLLGVLTKGVLDNGRGSARANVFRHKHEMETGRTSSISTQIMGFTPDGKVANYQDERTRETHSLRWSEIVEKSSKVISFSDLCGHERYLKTTLCGLTSVCPDYAMLVVDSNRGGVVGMLKEHLGIVLGLKIPFLVCVTKIDMCADHLLQSTMESVLRLLKRPGVHKKPIIVRERNDVSTCIKTMAGDSDVTPIFQVSCVENTNLDLLRLLLNHLPSRRQFDVQKKKTQNGEEEEELEETTNKHGKDECGALVHLDDAFTVNGVGTVVSGVVTKGSISTNQQLLLGPDSLGHFKEVVVKSTMTHRTSVLKAVCGQSASFAIKAKNSKEPVHKADVRKGMAMICKSLHPRATWSFEAEILIFVSPTTLTVGYAPVLHCMSVRQCARICKIEGKDVLRAGDRAKVVFQWLYRPEFVEEGFRVIFREGRTRGLGSITKVSFDGDKQKSWPDSRKQLHGTNMEAMMNPATATKSAG